MADEHAPTESAEPGELTSRFQAFAETTDPEPSKALPMGLIAAAAVALVVLVMVVWILVAK